MPKGLPWFRLYSEFAFDPKIQTMDETFQRRFVILMCLKCNGDIPGLTDETASCALRISPDDILKTKKLFIDMGLILENYEIVKWSERQYRSDSSTERVHKFRSKKSETLQKRKCNGNVTAPSVSVSKYVSLFDSFWKEYPKKVNKGQAEKTWNKIKPDKGLVGKMIAALSWQKNRTSWVKDDGEFIPHASTWLNARGWEDERKESNPHHKSFGGYVHVERPEPDHTDPVEKFLSNFPESLLPIKKEFEESVIGNDDFKKAFDDKLIELFADDEILNSKVALHLKQHPKSDERLYRKNYLYGKYGIPEMG
jgi:hypothetical protein